MRTKWPNHNTQVDGKTEKQIDSSTVIARKRPQATLTHNFHLSLSSYLSNFIYHSIVCSSLGDYLIIRLTIIDYMFVVVWQWLSDKMQHFNVKLATAGIQCFWGSHRLDSHRVQTHNMERWRDTTKHKLLFVPINSHVRIVYHIASMVVAFIFWLLASGHYITRQQPFSIYLSISLSLSISLGE